MAPKHELVKFCRTIIINKKYLNIWFCLNSLWKNSHHPGSEFHGPQPILQPLRPLWPHGVVPCRCTPLSCAAVATRGAGLHVASSWRGPDATHPISTLRGPWILRLDILFYILLHLAGKCNEYQWVVYTSNAGESHCRRQIVQTFFRICKELNKRLNPVLPVIDTCFTWCILPLSPVSKPYLGPWLLSLISGF